MHRGSSLFAAPGGRYNRAMTSPDRHDEHLSHLRRWRNRPAPDLTLAFVARQFKRDIEQPHKQIGRLVAAWEKLLPDELVQRTALVSLRRGVLTVEVPDSATLYELTGRLRDGLQQQLREQAKGSLHRVKVRLAGGEGTADTSRPVRTDHG